MSPTCLTLRGRFPLNEAAADKIRDYRADYNNRPSNAISFMPAVASTSGRLHCEFVRSQLKSKVGNILAKAAALRINLKNIDGAPIASRSHTHPSHSQPSRLLPSSLSLGVPVPRATQCMRGV